MKILYSLVLFCLLSNYGLAQTEFAPLGAKWYFSDGTIQSNNGFHHLFGMCTQYQVVSQNIVNGDVIKEIICDRNGVTNTQYIKQRTDGLLLESNDGINYNAIFNLKAKVGDTLRIKLVERFDLYLTNNGVDTTLNGSFQPKMIWADVVINKIDTTKHDSFFDDVIFTFNLLPDSLLQGDDLAFLIQRFPEAFTNQKFSTLYFGHNSLINEHFFSSMLFVNLVKIASRNPSNGMYNIDYFLVPDENHFVY